MRRALQIIGIAIGIIAVLIGAAVVIVTMTPWGHERLRRQVVEAMDSKTRGRVVRIGRVEGNLLRGITLVDVWIGDREGNVFVAIDTVTTRYGLRYLVRKKVVLTDVRFVDPIVILEKKPGDEDWNYETLFGPQDTIRDPADTLPGFGDWIRFERVRIVDGRFMIRRPWTPDEELTGVARDREIAERLAGTSRTRVEAVPGGFQQVVDFRAINGRFPLILLKDPDIDFRKLEVATLAMIAAPFNPPVLEVRDMSGEIHFDDDSLWFEQMRVEATGSKILGNGQFHFSSKDLDLRLRGEPVATTDLRWIYPHLPAEGQGTLNFALTWRDDMNTYAATDAAVRIGDARANGDFAITTSEDSVFFHDTDLRFSAVDTRLIEQLARGVDFPRRGSFGGRAALRGGIRALSVNADITFDEAGGARSRVAAVGGVGFGGGAMRADDLRLTLRDFQLDLLTASREDLPAFGALSGTARVDGSTASRLNVRARLEHEMEGALSRIAARGAVRLSGEPYVDIDARLSPLSLAAVGRFAPGLGLRSYAAGPVRVTGALSDLRVDADLRTGDGGSLDVDGRFDLVGEKRYEVALAAVLFNANLVLTRAPVTSLTARAAASGVGFDPATMRAAITADVETHSSIRDIGFDSAMVRVAIADGLARIDTFSVHAPTGMVEAEGTVALAGERAGHLTYRFALDSLQILNPYLGGDTAGVVAPRPARSARALMRARRDSIRIAQATEAERAVTGGPGPTLQADTPTVVRRDSLAGSVVGAGTISGTAHSLDVRGRIAARNLVVRGYTLQGGRADYSVLGLRGGSPAIVVGATLDTATIGGFQFDSVEARVAVRDDSGHVDVLVRQQDDQFFRLQAGLAMHEEHNELHIASAVLDIDTTRWVTVRPGTVLWGPAGIQVRTIELRRRPFGRIFVDGLLPTDGQGDLRVAVDHFEIRSIAALLQSDIKMQGLVSLEGRLAGTRAAPRFDAAFSLLNGRWGAADIPELHATAQYAGRSLQLNAQMSRLGGRPLGMVRGTIPVDLALGSVSGGRWLDRPISVDLTADSLPVDLLGEVTSAVRGVTGRAIGFVAVRGTGKNPRIAGAMDLERARLTITPIGVTVRNVAVAVRMSDNAITIDSMVGYSGGPIRVRGSVDLPSWSRPEFALRLSALNARLLDTERGRLRADATLKLDGPMNAPVVAGDVRIRSGVLYIPEPDDKSVIGTDDPNMFSVLDTSLAINEDIFPTESPMLANLRMNVTLAVDRDTWVRSREANVEVYTIDPITVHVDRARSALSLEGAVTTDRGQYTFLSRRFEIRRGSATFVGGNELNPSLQITGELPMRLPNREAFLLRVIIGGTLQSPRLSLESDAQPPLSQTELLSYVAFGDASSSLLPQEGSSLAAGAGGNNVGSIGALAVRQLTSVALGVVVDELEGDATRELGADVFNITPKAVPAELSANATESFLAGTEIEAGWYVDARTFLGIQQPLKIIGTNPGIVLQRRVGKGYFVETTFEPRYLLREPTFRNRPDARSVSVWGLFFGREWRY